MTDTHDEGHEPETTTAAAVGDDPQVVADRYRILRTLGRGGGGIVWLARDEKLGREVALKRVAGEADAEVLVTRGLREARTSATLAHENVVRVYDAFEFEGTPWIVMEHVPGPSLAALIEGGRTLPVAQVALIGEQVATALAAAHRAGIIHRDVKPGNVLLTDDTATNAKLTDFGIARAEEDAALTKTGFVAGTAAYFSPELARGDDPSPASDVWALGATLYAAVEGRRPFREEPNAVAQLHTIVREEPAPPTRAGALAPVLRGMLDTDPTRRWTAERAAAELRRVAGEASWGGVAGMGAGAAYAGPPSTQAVPVSEPTRAVPVAGERRPGSWPAAGAAAAGAGAAGAGTARAGSSAPPDHARRPPRGARPQRRGRPRRSMWLGWLLAVPLVLALGWLVWAIYTGLDPSAPRVGSSQGAEQTGPVSARDAEDLAQDFYDRLDDGDLEAARQLTTEDAYIAPDILTGLSGIDVSGLTGTEQADGTALVTARVSYPYGSGLVVQDERLTVAPVDDDLRIVQRFVDQVSGVPGQGEGPDEGQGNGNEGNEGQGNGNEGNEGGGNGNEGNEGGGNGNEGNEGQGNGNEGNEGGGGGGDGGDGGGGDGEDGDADRTG